MYLFGIQYPRLKKIIKPNFYIWKKMVIFVFFYFKSYSIVTTVASLKTSSHLAPIHAIKLLNIFILIKQNKIFLDLFKCLMIA